MSEALKQHMDQIMAEFEETRQELIQAQSEIAVISVTARSKDRAVEVTVGADGCATGLRFLNDKHKSMSGQALASSVLEVMTLAREEVTGRVRARVDAVARGGLGAMGRDRDGLALLNELRLDSILEPDWVPGTPLTPQKEQNYG
ncbi:YbaB/EbfC family nucleoid-associated protein [Streptomyces sp. NPDC051664]|uniref:YbaB/EbfC family nucleoid-associated protein n=1 Tax=Streptomyces sp. NPDC051664 TaxID=3365668 RepID=UPI0037B0D6E3